MLRQFYPSIDRFVSRTRQICVIHWPCTFYWSCLTWDIIVPTNRMGQFCPRQSVWKHFVPGDVDLRLSGWLARILSHKPAIKTSIYAGYIMVCCISKKINYVGSWQSSVCPRYAYIHIQYYTLHSTSATSSSSDKLKGVCNSHCPCHLWSHLGSHGLQQELFQLETAKNEKQMQTE